MNSRREAKRQDIIARLDYKGNTERMYFWADNGDIYRAANAHSENFPYVPTSRFLLVTDKDQAINHILAKSEIYYRNGIVGHKGH